MDNDCLTLRLSALGATACGSIFIHPIHAAAGGCSHLSQRSEPQSSQELDALLAAAAAQIRRHCFYSMTLPIVAAAPARVSLWILPSFMISTRFLSGSARRLMSCSGLPATTSRSAWAP